MIFNANRIRKYNINKYGIFPNTLKTREENFSKLHVSKVRNNYLMKLVTTL